MSLKPRPISAAESGLIHWLLSHAARVHDAGALAPQVAGLLVTEQCDCGCPSVDFLVEGLSATNSIVAEAGGRSSEGVPVGVLLWARADRLSGLEVYDLGDATTVSLPAPADLAPAVVVSAE